MTELHCPICLDLGKIETVITASEPRRRYGHCELCDVRFLAPDEHLSRFEERAFYASHENHLEDPRYRKYAEPIARAAYSKLSLLLHARATEFRIPNPGLRVLDFGCGPAPIVASVLEQIFQEGPEIKLDANVKVEFSAYDPIFRAAPELLANQFDLIASSEVIEHFRSAGAEFHKLFELLRPGGWLVLQTERTDHVADFDRWYYRRDPTHVSFYSEATFWLLAGRLGMLDVEFPTSKIACMRKPLFSSDRL